MESVVVFTDVSIRPNYIHKFVRIFYERWGIRSVLVFPTAVPAAVVAECSAQVGSQGVAAMVRADEQDLQGLATYLSGHYRVLAVVPQAEYQVGVAGKLCALLDIDWLPPSTIARFRDKQSLKDHIRQHPNAPRINRTRRVESEVDVRQWVDECDITRFVLKPNDGAGNQRVAFFDVPTTGPELKDYFDTNQGVQVLAEEFIDGPEYCVNGQVDESGTVRVFSVQLATHQSGNGRSNLAGGFRMLPTSTKEFRLACDYAVDVLRAAGLRRSPYHLDIKIDEQGPSLIEAGARLGGAGIPEDTKLAHRGTLDPFVEAARCYLPDTPGTPTEPDWAVYDSSHITTVVGLAPRSEVIVELSGVHAVEDLPEFAYWVMPVQLGQRVQRTVDLNTAPWQLTLDCGTHDRLLRLEDEVRTMIHWNDVSGLSRTVIAKAAWARRRLPALPYLALRRPRRI